MEEKNTSQGTSSAVTRETANEYLQAGLSVLPASRCDKRPCNEPLLSRGVITETPILIRD